MKRLSFLLVGASLFGCSTTIQDVCEALEEAETDQGCFEQFLFDDCIDDGSELRSRALPDCEDPFFDYLDCVEVELCTYEVGCASQRAALEECVGPFP